MSRREVTTAHAIARWIERHDGREAGDRLMSRDWGCG